ncbi:MAG: NnrS family protein [Betaproteobacteria bacterium]
MSSVAVKHSPTLWNLGFRPFFLFASLFSAASIALWTAQYAGYLPFQYLKGPPAHGSEMLFGYAMAVIAGFLFTAVRNWTGKPTPSGVTLACIVALWVAGRVLAVTPLVLLAASANAAFAVAVATGIGIPLLRSGNRRNYFFVALLIALGGSAVALQLSFAGALEWPARANIRVGLDLVLFIMAVMGGRVIPMFTNNGVPGAQARRNPIVERLSLAGILVLVVADLIQLPAVAAMVLCAALAVVHATRLLLWQPWRTLRTPLVWILHAGYAWIVIHLVLRALAAIELVPDLLAVHALTIGGIGGLTIGMMTRTTRGHTGRPLVANRSDRWCYALVMLGALARVAGPLALPDAYVATVIAAGVCWTTAFLTFAIAYGPSLLRPRVDGRPG